MTLDPWSECSCGKKGPHLKEYCTPPALRSLTTAECDGKAMACIEGTRVLKLDDCTVSVVSVFPDGTAYVVTRKTFPEAVIEAGRRKWKIQTHADRYGVPFEQYAQQQAYAQQMQGTMEDAMMAALMGMTMQDYLRHKKR